MSPAHYICFAIYPLFAVNFVSNVASFMKNISNSHVGHNDHSMASRENYIRGLNPQAISKQLGHLSQKAVRQSKNGKGQGRVILEIPNHLNAVSNRD
jgi:hypothetical protein